MLINCTEACDACGKGMMANVNIGTIISLQIENNYWTIGLFPNASLQLTPNDPIHFLMQLISYIIMCIILACVVVERQLKCVCCSYFAPRNIICFDHPKCLNSLDCRKQYNEPLNFAGDCGPIFCHKNVLAHYRIHFRGLRPQWRHSLWSVVHSEWTNIACRPALEHIFCRDVTVTVETTVVGDESPSWGWSNRPCSMSAQPHADPDVWGLHWQLLDSFT